LYHVSEAKQLRKRPAHAAIQLPLESMAWM
jgi:hypothetical protein